MTLKILSTASLVFVTSLFATAQASNCRYQDTLQAMVAATISNPYATSADISTINSIYFLASQENFEHQYGLGFSLKNNHATSCYVHFVESRNISINNLTVNALKLTPYEELQLDLTGNIACIEGGEANLTLSISCEDGASAEITSTWAGDVIGKSEVTAHSEKFSAQVRDNTGYFFGPESQIDWVVE